MGESSNRFATPAKASRARAVGLLAIVLLLLFAPIIPLRAASLAPSLLPRIQAATFEVVLPKPAKDNASYETRLPLESLPFQERNDRYLSIGTAFALGGNRYVTAGHVLRLALGAPTGPAALRDAHGQIYAIDQIEKFSFQQDFVVFSLSHPPTDAALEIDHKPVLNSVVFAVGNALGAGVVIRDGLYTSDTPEEQDARWKWMRFSAAASPGNSGGPLLDEAGKVIGVVLMKSPNENLNYALPIDDMLDAPSHLASIDQRESFQFPLMPQVTKQATFKQQFALPLSYATFEKTWLDLSNGFAEQQLKALLQDQQAELFPRGDGAQHLLHGPIRLDNFPTMLGRDNDGSWKPIGRPARKFELPNNGYVAMGAGGGVVLAHLRRPDDLTAGRLDNDPQRLLDLLLTGGLLHRSVGQAQIKITSLGKPDADDTYTDRWQRRWQLRRWVEPRSENVLLVDALPVPDGDALLIRMVPAGQTSAQVAQLRLLSDYVNVSYSGNLREWADYLGQRTLLPAALRELSLQMDEGKKFSYASPRLSFSYGPEVQAISPDNFLVVGMGFFYEHNQAMWDVGNVWIGLNSHDKDHIDIQRHAAPITSRDDDNLAQWQHLLHAQHPFDGVAYDKDDVMRIARPVPANEADKREAIYSAFVGVSGSRSQATMQQRLDALEKNLRINAR